MTVQDFPVTLPYGSTAPPYDATHKHRGRDYGCPTGTPLVVAGQQIGLSGATGHVIGAHCHVQEWKGDYANTREPNDAFQGGTVTNIDPNGTQGDGSFGKFITVVNADGWLDTYCHLSRIDVKVGDRIGGTMEPTDYRMNEGDIDTYYRDILGRPASKEDIAAWTGQTHKKFLYEVVCKAGFPAQANKGFKPYSGPQLFVEDK